jgi:hypothetical protein
VINSTRLRCKDSIGEQSSNPWYPSRLIVRSMAANPEGDYF